MDFPRISFMVRSNETAHLSDLGNRVGAVFNCHFMPSSDKTFEGDEALEATLLGMWITLRYAPQHSDAGMRNYHLAGGIARNLRQSHRGRFLDISTYILGILQSHDHPNWYFPDKQELLADAGITEP